MRTCVFAALALLVPALLFQSGCSSPAELADEGTQADVTLLEIDEQEGEDMGVDVSEPVPGAAVLDEQAEVERGGAFGAPAARMRFGVTLEEALERYYQNLTNYTLSYFVMAQEAFAAGELTRAVHLAERSAELVPNEQVYIFKAYLFEIMDDYARALQALERVDLDQAGLRTYSENLALNLARRRALDQQAPPVEPFVLPVERTVRGESVPSGYYVRLASMQTEPEALAALENIADYFAITFEREPFAGAVVADRDVFAGGWAWSEAEDDAPAQDEPAAGPYSVLIGPFETREQATVAHSRLRFFHAITELVERP